MIDRLTTLILQYIQEKNLILTTVMIIVQRQTEPLPPHTTPTLSCCTYDLFRDLRTEWNTPR